METPHPYRSSKVTTEPTVEPVSLTEMLGHVRLGKGDHDEPKVRSLLTAARRKFERVTGRRLITQTILLDYDFWPAGRLLVLPFAPLQSVASITYVDGEGTVQTLSSALYTARTADVPGSILLDHDQTWPTHRVEPGAVRVSAVFGVDTAGEVPEEWRQAIMVRAATMYEAPESVVAGMSVSRFPAALHGFENFRIRWG